MIEKVIIYKFNVYLPHGICISARYSKCTTKSPVCITAFKVSVFNSRSTDFVTLVYVIFNLFHRQSFFDLEFNSLVK